MTFKTIVFARFASLAFFLVNLVVFGKSHVKKAKLIPGRLNNTLELIRLHGGTSNIKKVEIPDSTSKQPFTLSHYINGTFSVSSFNPTFVGTEFELFDNNNISEQVETKSNQNLYFETDETSGDIFVKDIFFSNNNNVSAYSVKFAEISSSVGGNSQEKAFVNFVSNDAKYSGFKETLMS